MSTNIRVALMLALFLFACDSHAENQAQQRIAYFKSQCQQYGYQPGTGDFANCVMQLDQADQQRQAQQNQARQNQANQLFRQLISIPPYQLPMPVQPTLPTNTNTNCYQSGNQVYCNSTTR